MNNLTNNSKHSYRAWPIFMLAFINLFHVSIFERALSNYLYFNIGIRESTLGFITSAGALTYIFAPILGVMITRKIGIRKALILNAIIIPLLTGAQIFYIEPWFLIICRIGLGLTIGLFWPNCLYLLSKWQRVSSVEKSNKTFAIFNLSWNSGFIIGLLVGFIWAFFWNDYLTMIIAWTLSFLLIPVSLFIKKESQLPDPNKKIIYQTEDPLSHLDIKENLTINSSTPMVVYPILFSWLAVIFFTTSKSIIFFNYPILLKIFEKPSEFTYLVQAGLQITQLMGLTLVSSMKTYSRKIASLISMLGIIMIVSSIIFIGNIWYISIITACVGLFLGFIQGIGMKIMLEYGTKENSTKYSITNEILVGMGFGIPPLIVGYVAEVNVYLSYTYIIVFGLIVLIIFLYLSRNIKRH